jgi:hypothetical protein
LAPHATDESTTLLVGQATYFQTTHVSGDFDENLTLSLLASMVFAFPAQATEFDDTVKQIVGGWRLDMTWKATSGTLPFREARSR